jgi:tetratricopeptide (TPR) repeat protein
MASSKEVFSLRKQGSLAEAYAMACQLIDDDPDDDWNKRALGWCLYDLVKKHVADNNYPAAQNYANQLDNLDIDESDDILWKSREQARIQATPEKRIILEAKAKSKEGNHQVALDLFRQAIKLFPDDTDLNNNFAWELQKEGKIIFDTEKVDLTKARKLLAEYIVLKNDRPALVHSLFLRLADKITDREEFNLIAFLKLWDLNNLMHSDYEPFSKDGNTYPALAEKIIQHAGKLILDKKLSAEVQFLLPFLDIVIGRYPDNIWLTYYKAKLLHLVGRDIEAIHFLKPVIKEKIGDYWCWSLLGDLLSGTNNEKAMSCYCKALLCSGEEKFLANVRLKFAELLIKNENLPEAKYEILKAIATKEMEGSKVQEKILNYKEFEWFKAAAEERDNLDFYRKNKTLAEEFIFEDLAWLDGCIGETFTIPEKPDKIRRKLYAKLEGDIIEFSTSDRRFLIFKKARPGDSIKVKGELDKEKKFQLYLLELNTALEPWSIFDWQEANVLQPIRADNQLVYAWGLKINLAKQSIDSTIKVENLPSDVRQEGAAVHVKVHVKRFTGPVNIFAPSRTSKTNVIAAKRRTGEPWDLVPEIPAIVDHLNAKKGVAHFIANKEISGTIKVSNIKGNVTLGTRVKVRVRKVKKGLESYYASLSARITDEEPDPKLLRKFSGRIELTGLVGFCDDVFVERDFINANNLKDGISITGTAIMNYNKKRLKWGWKALSIDSVIVDGLEIPGL